MTSNKLPESIVEHLKIAEAKVGFKVVSFHEQKEWVFGNRRFLAASTIKLPIMAAFYNACFSGLSSLNELYEFNPQELIEDSPILEKYSGQIKIPLADLVRAMIVLSDNTATNIIINRLGFPYIQNWLKEHHFKETELNRLMMDMKSREKGIDNWTTPVEMCQFMEDLYHNRYVCEKYNREMISILNSTEDLEKIPFYFKYPTKVANKPGELAFNRSDVALIVENSRCMAMSVFCDEVKNEQKTDLWIAEFARLFWNLKIS